MLQPQNSPVGSVTNLGRLISAGDYSGAVSYVRDRLATRASPQMAGNDVGTLILHAENLCACGGLGTRELFALFSRAPKLLQLEALLDIAYRQTDMDEKAFDRFFRLAEITRQRGISFQEDIAVIDDAKCVTGHCVNIAKKLLLYKPPEYGSYNHQAASKVWKMITSHITPTALMLALTEAGKNLEAATRKDTVFNFRANLRAFRVLQVNDISFWQPQRGLASFLGEAIKIFGRYRPSRNSSISDNPASHPKLIT